MTVANTAANVSELSVAEKEAIMYINLARLYPREFASIHLQTYTGPAKYGGYLKGSKYLASLITHLNEMTPTKALVFDEDMYQKAKCFAKEQGIEGSTGHTRKTCPNLQGSYAECCSYGMETGLDIALQWLIDHDVPSLGHRINCLNPSYSKIGLSIHPHKQWGTWAVADLLR